MSNVGKKMAWALLSRDYFHHYTGVASVLTTVTIDHIVRKMYIGVG